MSCRNVFQIAVLATLLFGIVACEEQAQRPAPQVVSQEPAVAEPVVVIEPVAEVNKDQSSPDDEVVVRYGEEKLTMRHIQYRKPKADTKTIKKIADSWIRLQLLYEEAKKRGFTEDPMAKSEAKLAAKQMYVQTLARAMQDAVQITEEQMRDYYEKNKEADGVINVPTKFSFSHVATASLQDAQGVVNKIKAGADIGTVARDASIDLDGRRAGGAVKNLSQSSISRRYGKEFAVAFLAASAGDLIGPIRSGKGRAGDRYEVARFDERKEGGMKSFEESKDYIEARLLRAKKKTVVVDLAKSLEEKAADKIYRSERILKEEEPAKKNLPKNKKVKK
jgi:peptidyl-prolyl cis-trans isomerase C